MRTVLEYLQRIWAWVRQLCRREKSYHAISVEELPDQLRPYSLYTLGDPDCPWSAAMVCPCGCGELLHLSLLPEDRPHWSLSSNERGQPTLHPSVWRHDGCQAHFFLRAGQIQWCGPKATCPISRADR